MKRYYYLEVKQGEKVVARKPTTATGFNTQWSNLERELNNKSLDISLSVSDEKEKVFNHLISA